jgi:hypothetical protein
MLGRMQAALGGAERLAAVADMEQHLSADTWDDRGRHLGRTAKRIRWMAPGQLRMDQRGPGNTLVLYFDGVSGWEIVPGGTAAIPGQLEHPCSVPRPLRRYLHAASLGPAPSSIRMVAGWAASWTMTARTCRRAVPVTTARIGVSPGNASVSPFCSLTARAGVS